MTMKKIYILLLIPSFGLAYDVVINEPDGICTVLNKDEYSEVVQYEMTCAPSVEKQDVERFVDDQQKGLNCIETEAEIRDEASVYYRITLWKFDDVCGLSIWDLLL